MCSVLIRLLVLLATEKSSVPEDVAECNCGQVLRQVGLET